MAGVYIHIPFCKSRCRYCDFYSTTMLERRREYVDAILQEWNQYQPLQPIFQPVNTLYLGGGTPSLLDADDIKRIVDTIATADTQEITLEANPGDLNEERLSSFIDAGINRISLGIQSFDDNLLQLIGRRHDAKQAIESVRNAQKAGIANISIDLMYGLPTQTMEIWLQTIAQALSLGVQHISCYCLSYEEGTPLFQALENGEIKPIDDELENEMYDYLCQTLERAGFEHYEVSNFALSGYQSQHNSSYWDNTPYIGLGAAAHSYDGKKRYWNSNDLEQYIQDLHSTTMMREEEILTDEQRHIEQIMLSLRTNKGIEESIVANRADKIEEYLSQGLLRRENGRIIATLQGTHILNRIIEDLL